MLPKLCRDVALYLPEILDATCKTFASSKAPSKLICLLDAHVPISHVFDVNCSKYANRELIITQCSVVSLLRKTKLTCGGKTEL